MIMFPALRNAYVSLHVLFGALIAVWAVLVLLEGLAVDPGMPPYDGPLPISFYGYAGGPLFAGLLFASAYAAYRAHWELATIVWWFVFWKMALGTIVDSILFERWPFSPTDLVVFIILLYSASVIAFAYGLEKRDRAKSRPVSLRSGTLLGIEGGAIRRAVAWAAVVAFGFRALVLVLGPKASWVTDMYFGSDVVYPAREAFVLNSVLGLVAALAHVAALLAPRGWRDWLINPMLAMALVVSLQEFLSALDLLSGLAGSAAPGFVLMYGAIFLGCAIAIGLTPRRDAQRLAP